MKALNPKQKRYLRALAHNLKPVVIIGGAGLSESVINEINQSIEHHELIKVRINASDRQSRIDMMQTICEATNSILVFSIGHIAVLYRPAKQPVLSLPK
jgi:RNA-binding protein